MRSRHQTRGLADQPIGDRYPLAYQPTGIARIDHFFHLEPVERANRTTSALYPGIDLRAQGSRIRSFRRNPAVLFVVSIFVNIGMWFERFVIIATTLARDFTPSAWGMFHPTWVDICTFIGTFGLFGTLFLLFIRFLPMICMFEVKAVLPEADPHHGEAHH